MVLEWTFDGEVLEMHALDNGDEPVAHAQFIVGGIYLIVSSADATTEAPDTVTLRFANIVDDLPVQIVAWLVEVQRLSGGSIEFEFVNDYGAGATSGAESATLADIGSGTIDIGWVGARVVPRVLDASSAPMLVDSYGLLKERCSTPASRPACSPGSAGAPGIVARPPGPPRTAAPDRRRRPSLRGPRRLQRPSDRRRHEPAQPGHYVQRSVPRQSPAPRGRASKGSTDCRRTSPWSPATATTKRQRR